MDSEVLFKHAFQNRLLISSNPFAFAQHFAANRAFLDGQILETVEYRIYFLIALSAQMLNLCLSSAKNAPSLFHIRLFRHKQVVRKTYYKFIGAEKRIFNE